MTVRAQSPCCPSLGTLGRGWALEERRGLEGVGVEREDLGRDPHYPRPHQVTAFTQEHGPLTPVQWACWGGLAEARIRGRHGLPFRSGQCQPLGFCLRLVFQAWAFGREQDSVMCCCCWGWGGPRAGAGAARLSCCWERRQRSAAPLWELVRSGRGWGLPGAGECLGAVEGWLGGASCLPWPAGCPGPSRSRSPSTVLHRCRACSRPAAQSSPR